MRNLFRRLFGELRAWVRRECTGVIPRAPEGSGRAGYLVWQVSYDLAHAGAYEKYVRGQGPSSAEVSPAVRMWRLAPERARRILAGRSSGRCPQQLTSADEGPWWPRRQDPRRLP